MPEGPEVWLCRKMLAESKCLGRAVTVEGRFTETLRDPIPDLTPINHRKLVRVVRSGKILGFEFDNDLTIVSHLGMTGMWNIVDGKRPPDRSVLKHQHVVLKFAGPTRSMDVRWVYTDARKFGMIALMDRQQVNAMLARLGPEPTKEQSSNWLAQGLSQVSDAWTIKQYLMDPSKVLGIGNIYASEILNHCQIWPGMRANDAASKAPLILEKTKLVLAKAMALGGSSIHTYRNPRGGNGKMQEHYVAYNRDGTVCKACKTGTIIKGVLKDGRSSYWCNNCQAEES